MGGKTNLRRSRTLFVGRARELRAVSVALAEGERIVTLVGPAGIGKTRLAMQTIEARLNELPGGAWFCDLTESTGAQDVDRAIARTLPDELGPGPALLVLDNCEQVAAPLPATIDELLSASPDLQLLLTSRERLRIDGELVVELGPLALPEAAAGSPGEVEASEAAALFVDRARRVAVDFALTGETAPVIAQIVRRLDGMPLAIELAAARIAVLGPADLLARLERRFDLLSSRARDASPRHRTLRAAIDWSWEMLEQWEQAGLAQLSVFRGGFTIEAADRVVRVQRFPGAPDVIGGLSWLRDKSLVWKSEDRFGLYLSIRDYAAEKLAAMELEDETVRRHVDYFAARARAGELDVDVEQENLMAAFDRAAARWPGDPEPLGAGLACLLALEELRATRGPWPPYLERLARAIEAPAFAALPPETRARAHQARGRIHGFAGAFDRSTLELERALTLAEEAGDLALEASLRLRLGVLAMRGGMSDVARERYRRALAIARELGDRFGEAQALANLAVIDGEEGRVREARAGLERVREIYAELGERALVARTLGNLATLLQDEGEVEEARVGYRRAIEELREIGDRRDAAVFEGFLGTSFHEHGHAAEARAAYEAALAELGAIGDRPFAGLFRSHLAVLAAARGEIERAATMLADAEPALVASGDRRLLELARAHLDLAYGRAADQRGAGEAATERRRRARAVLEDDGGAGSQRARVAARILARALGAPSGERASAALVVGPEGRWFVPPGGDRIDLARRQTIRRVLHELARQRREAPGVGLGTEELFRAGWPGERINRRAAANRVRVALATLRKLGLRDQLVTASDGYLIDPSIEVQLVE